MTGRLAYRERVRRSGRTDEVGAYHSWPVSKVKFTVEDKLEAHAALLPMEQDDDAHNVLK